MRNKLLPLIFKLAGPLAPAAAGRLAFNRFCSPPRRLADARGHDRIEAAMAPLFARAQTHTIAHPNGTVAAYLWRQGGLAAKGRVLLLHGWSADARVMGLFVDPLLKAGFDVVALDLPAQGRSSGRYLNMPLGARAVLAVDRVLGPITAAVTHSFGGPIAALAAEGGLPLDVAFRNLQQLVLIASPNRLTAMADAFANRHAMPDSVRWQFKLELERAMHRPIETVEVGRFVAAFGRPTLIIHDEADEDVPFERAEAIVASAPNAILMRTNGLGHRRIVITPAVIRATVRFVAGVTPATLGAGRVAANSTP